MRALVISPFLLIIAAAGLFAEGKITVDPNAPGSRPAEEIAGDIDSRLDQQVTYEAKQKRVIELLSELSEKTGVTLKAGQNSKDWESQDVKMNVFVKDVPLRELMASMARVMKFRWSREGKEGDYTYRFYMTRKTKLEAEARRTREEDERQKRLAEKRSKALATYSQAANLAPEELAKLKTENPFLYAVSSTGILSSLGAFLAESPAAAEALMTGRAASISAASLSGAGQQALLKSMQQLRRFENTLTDTNRPLPDDISDNIGQVNVVINRFMEDMGAMPQVPEFILGEMSISYGGHDVMFPIPIFDPEGGLAKLFGKALIKSQEEGVPLKDSLKGLEFEAMKVLQTEMKKADAGEPEPEHPDEPALHAKIKFKPEESQLASVQAELAKASGLSIVSDCYGPGWAITQFGGGEELELKTILDKIAEAYGCNWEKHGSILEFRDRKWYEKRAALIPWAWLESWRQTLMKTGTLDLDDLAQVASLTIAQVNGNFSKEDKVLSRPLMVAWHSSRDVLRLYGSLDEAQKAAIFAPGGLDLRSLAPEQWALAEKLINSKNAAYLANPDAAVTLSATRTPQGKRFRYVFTVAAEGADPLEWSLTTPLYEKPEPKTAAEPEADSSKQNPRPIEDAK